MKWVSSYIATQQQADQRFDTCKRCINMSALNMCNQCGCFMPAKVRLKHSYCPIQFWGPIEDTGEQHPVSPEYYEELNKD